MADTATRMLNAEADSNDAEMIHHGQVDLNPSYQRDVVWPHSKMCGLIESLFLVSAARALMSARAACRE